MFNICSILWKHTKTNPYHFKIWENESNEHWIYHLMQKYLHVELHRPYHSCLSSPTRDNTSSSFHTKWEQQTYKFYKRRRPKLLILYKKTKIKILFFVLFNNAMRIKVHRIMMGDMNGEYLFNLIYINNWYEITFIIFFSIYIIISM